MAERRRDQLAASFHRLAELSHDVHRLDWPLEMRVMCEAVINEAVHMHALARTIVDRDDRLTGEDLGPQKEATDEQQLH
mgnify:CR=1 FL=1